MKIYSDPRLGEITLASKNNRPEPGTKAGNFADFLSQAVEKTTTDHSASSGIVGAQTSNLVDNQMLPNVVQQVNGLLDTLDRYGQALSDSQKSLREIEPLVNKLESQTQRLESKMDIDAQNALYGLAQETMAQAKVEIIKFRRGDYI